MRLGWGIFFSPTHKSAVHIVYRRETENVRPQLVQRKCLERTNLMLDVSNHFKINVLLTGGSSSAGGVEKPGLFSYSISIFSFVL
ncbi:hypothetical protein GDO78_022020 [Eleutherodactylus coqui]|uniref:Uncharacterized protein n=1 Tax=Eleutherodactylus coqui TaxID=57060 RepID=A0A8J6EM96_ELECQ|nr:hypothetical protein GDO78_022020 [Eleutherodactylus coqui]